VLFRSEDSRPRSQSLSLRTARSASSEHGTERMRERRLSELTRWICTGAVVMILVAWVTSLCWIAGWARCTVVRNDRILVGGGAIAICWERQTAVEDISNPEVGLFLQRLPYEARWTWCWTPTWACHGGTLRASFPLWTLFTAATIPAGLLWRQAGIRARRGRSLCPSCGYDRRGLVPFDSPCPECGRSLVLST